MFFEVDSRSIFFIGGGGIGAGVGGMGGAPGTDRFSQNQTSDFTRRRPPEGAADSKGSAHAADPIFNGGKHVFFG